MATFSYRAKDTKGDVIEGTLDAENEPSVVSRLQAMGYFPIKVVDQSRTGQGRLHLSLRRPVARRRVRAIDLCNFARQLADLIGAGIPLVKALNILTTQTGSDALGQIVSQVNKDVQSGDTLARAMSRHSKVFSRLMVAMVRAGETGGMLDNVLQRIADFMEAEEELKGRVKSALAYPVVLIVASLVAVIVMMTVVIPKIVNIFIDLNQTLPLPTEILIGITDFLKIYGLHFLIVLGLVCLLVWRFGRSEEGLIVLHRFLLRLPVVGIVVLKREIARFTRTLGALLRNGVPILTALEIAQEVITNRVVRRDMARLPEDIAQGAKVADTLRESQFFPTLATNMVAVGEETGQLADVLMRVADSYESQVDRSVRTLSSLIEPLIILFMGLLVGFIVISMLLPIFSLDPTTGG